MIVVLDASVAIEIVLQRNFSAKFSQYIMNADWVIAPTLFIAEVCNVFWKYQKLDGYSFKDCEINLDQALALPDDFSDDSLLYREAFKLGCNLNHPVYDTLYLTLARRNNGILLSMDTKLLKVARECSIETGA